LAPGASQQLVGENIVEVGAVPTLWVVKKPCDDGPLVAQIHGPKPKPEFVPLNIKGHVVLLWL
jgi:hypothetical protein